MPRPTRRRTAALYACALGLVLTASGAARADFAEGYARFQAEDYSAAADALRPVAETGDRRAQYLLGHMLRAGLGGEADPAGGLDWLNRAAAPPDPDRFALFELGVMHEQGEGVPADPAVAADYYARAAARGVPAALLNLGVLNARGLGVRRDLPRALALFHEAAEAGQPGAADYFATLAQGAGGDPPVAGRWQAVDYAGSADDPTWRNAAERLTPHVGARLQLGRRSFSVGQDACPRPTFLARPAAADALTLDAVGATPTVLPPAAAPVPDAPSAGAPEGPARPALTIEVVCDGAVHATLAAPGDGRLLLSALGGYLVFEPVPSERVRSAQTQLAALGFDPGPADGVYGPRTAAAVQAFENAAGLPGVGTLSPRLFAALATPYGQQVEPDRPACGPSTGDLLCGD